jgi:D-alanyl-D-alanine carboxypeptidase/D-alanyl-D-alanine-endopeptidase (penicillin-binding protein 4)
MVTTLEGEELIAIRPDERFTPASNTKLVTTAAVFHALPGLNASDPSQGPSLRLEPGAGGGPPDLVLVGGGDGRLGDGPDCVAFCLAELADALVEARITEVGNVIGDDTLFPDERWGAGWSWNNLETRSGTAISALSVNNNELWLTVSPAASTGQAPTAVWREGDDLLGLINEAVTTRDASPDLTLERRPGSGVVRLYGGVAEGAADRTLVVSVEDPALAAARRLHRLLEARHIKVTGTVGARHRPLQTSDDPGRRREGQRQVAQRSGTEIARLIPPPLLEELTVTAKISQNLYAELLLRRLGLIEGEGSSAEGLAIVETMLSESGANPNDFTFADGSGMSVYNRVTPRMMTGFLQWAARQTWGSDWRKTLPVAGVDGSLLNRFRDGPLVGRLSGKTGTLNGVNALAGYMTTAKGRTLAFAVYANDRPPGSGSAIQAMDRTLEAIAAAY